MRSSLVTFVVPALLAFGLSACSKDSKNSIKARAETAVTKEQQQKVYADAETSIDKDIADLSANNVHTMDKGFSFMKSVNQLLFIKPKDMGAAVHTLNAIVSKTESQIKMAKKLGDAKMQAHAEKTKAKAERTLKYF